ncbi:MULTISPECIES: pentapeptide repeat-containing protein [unclassified Streptomyces]|uniref:pentapeptide repeat-containing protein n=1 Tax=unclassified Streptomyces TaxID=2593676 RepID=UPI00324D0061
MPNHFKPRPKPQGRHTPNLWPVWAVAPFALIIVGALAFGLYRGAEALLTAGSTSKKPVDVQDVIKTTITVLTLVGAVLAALYAYRKQLLDEGASHRADATQLAERYTTAAEQLGHDQPPVRLAGVYALARLADDWPEQRQVCVDVLCAYLRMPYETDPAEPGFKTGEREVRLTIIRMIRDHLQDPKAPTTWCGLDLDFTGATFDGGDFRGAKFSGGKVAFSAATFSDGEVNFGGATFSGSAVAFSAATFSGGTVDFSAATFSDGTVDFIVATFVGGRVDFDTATFCGSQVNFRGATLSDDQVDFSRAQFSGGKVDFSHAKFSGSRVNFSRAKFSGSRVVFGGATYSGGRVVFGGATFSGGRVTFDRAMFSGCGVYFAGATFSDGRVTFDSVWFRGGVVDFRDASPTGGTVDFANVRVYSGISIAWGPFPAISVNQP